MMCQMNYEIHKKEETSYTIQPSPCKSRAVSNEMQDWQKRDLLPQFLNSIFHTLASFSIVLHMVLLTS